TSPKWPLSILIATSPWQWPYVGFWLKSHGQPGSQLQFLNQGPSMYQSVAIVSPSGWIARDHKRIGGSDASGAGCRSRSRPMRASDGKSLIEASAIAIVATPPATTVVTAPKIAATAPDSNAPSSFDAEMNTISTAPTRPRSSFGVTIATEVERMFTLNMSTNPARARAASVRGIQVEAPH